MYYNIWLLFCILPYTISKFIYYIFINYYNPLDALTINAILTNEDYYHISKIIDIKYGVNPQNFIFINSNKWYYDYTYANCINKEMRKIKKLNICVYNGTHVVMNKKIYYYDAWLTGVSYCINDPPNRIVRSICVHWIRTTYELCLIYLFTITIGLFVMNITHN